MNYERLGDLDAFVDEVVEIVIERMGGFDVCADFFTTRRGDDLQDFAADMYLQGLSAQKAAKRYLVEFPEARHFLATGNLELPPLIRKPKAMPKAVPTPEPAHKAARRKREAMWKAARGNVRQSIEALA